MNYGRMPVQPDNIPGERESAPNAGLTLLEKRSLSRLFGTVWQRSTVLWTNRGARNGILIALTVASLGALVWGLVKGWRDIVSYTWQLDLLPLGISTLVYAVSLFLVIVGWMVITRTLDIRSHWRQDAKFFILSWLARRLPTPGPYFASRVMLYEGAGVPKRLTSMGLLWENVALLASGAVLGLMLVPATQQLIGDQYTIVPMLIAGAASLVFVARPMLMARVVNLLLLRFKKEPISVVIKPWAAAIVLLIYGLVWALGGVVLFLLIRSLHSLDWTYLPLVIQCWVLSGLASHITFFTPISFGIREVTLAALLALVLPFSVAVVIAILIRFWMMANELLWALILAAL
jgi:hypothetical protein